MYDVLKNIKQSAYEIALREGRIGLRSKNRGYLLHVADHYCGAEKTATDLTYQLAGISVTLSWKVIEAIGDLLNKEEPDRAKVTNANDENGDLEYPDAILCRHLFSKSSLRGATTFKTVASEADQINTLRRLSFIAPQRDYKPVTKNELEVQTRRAIAARKEVAKMEEKVGGHPWPEDMKDVKQTLLSKTILDDEVEKNNKGLLPVLQELWEELFPIAAELENAHSCSKMETECTASDNNSSISSLPASENEDQKDEIAGELNTCTIKSAPINEDEDDSQVSQAAKENEALEKQLSPLELFSIRAENITWQTFKSRLIDEDLYDFIFADPQQALSSYELNQSMWTEVKDESKIKEFANFCCLSLRPGCYAFIFVLTEEFCAWSSAFKLKV